jgi:hypothetical protein
MKGLRRGGSCQIRSVPILAGSPFMRVEATKAFDDLYHDRHNHGPGVRGHHVAKLSHRSRPGYTGDLVEHAMRFDPIVGSDGLI